FSSATWHPSGSMLATCCQDSRIRLWNTVTWQQTLVLEGHQQGGVQCAFTRDGDWLLSNDWDSLLRVWDVHSGRQLFSTPMSYDMRQFSPDGRLPVHDGNKLKLIRLASAREFRTLSRRTAAGLGAYATIHASVVLSPDGRLLAATTAEGFCAFVDPA